MTAPAFRYVAGFSRTARLVLDVRDWYAGAFRADALRRVDLTAVGGGKEDVVRAVVRPTRRLTVTAGPSAGEKWFFPGEVEMVTPVTPAGLLVFYGRVRGPDGGPLRRLPLGGVVCDLTIAGDGYETAVVRRVAVPDRGQPPETIRVELTPGPDLPPGATELAGGLFAADGAPLKRARVRVLDDAETVLVTVWSDDAGLWRAEVRSPARPTPLTVEVLSEGLTDRLRMTVTPGRANRVPQTVLRGTVRRGDVSHPESYKPVAGARVTVAAYPGATTTRADGTWVFYPPRSEPLTGERETVVVVEPPGEAPAAVPARVLLGEGNTVPAITLPEQV